MSCSQIAHPTDKIFVGACHSGDDNAARRADCRENEGGLVADAASRVFRDLGACDVGKFEGFARQNHFVGKNGGFLRAHILEENRHNQRSHLRFRHFVVENGVHNITDFLFGEFVSVALFFDEVCVGSF